MTKIHPKYKCSIIVIAICLTGYFFSCQCNNPTIREPETTSPENAQSGTSTKPPTGTSTTPPTGTGTTPPTGPTPPTGTTPPTGSSKGKHNGIPNCGNTCYMNATLQTLFALYGDLIKSKGKGAAAGTMAANMLNLFNKVTNPAGGASITKDEMKDFYNSMDTPGIPVKAANGSIWMGKVWNKPFNKQEDASELLTEILGFLGVPNIKTYQTLTKENEPTKQRKSDQETGIKIEIPIIDSIKTMQDAINNYFKEEIMEGDAAVEWEGGVKFKTNRKTQLKELCKIYNNTLIISLGRFQTNQEGPKLNHDISNIFEVTITKDQAVDLTQDKTYQLKSFILHIGNFSNSGHYMTYIKEDGEWVCYNDNGVSKVSDADAATAAKKAYVFFYQPK